MANKPTRPSPRPAGTKGSSTRPKLLWLWVALGAVVVLAAGIAVLSSGDDEELSVGSTVPAGTDGGGDSTSPTDSTNGGDGGGTTTPPQSAEVWPVTLDGDALPELPDGGADPAIGVTAPALSGFTFDGTPIAVDPSKGPVMLVFLAHWCPHCNREVPQLLAWQASGAVPDGLQVIAVTTAVDPSRDNYPPSKWIVDMAWDWPVLADSQANETAIAYGLSGFPFTVILDTDGKVLTRWSGEVGQAGIQERVDAALA
jgi:cytochrome c biogenesis protein CcmG, thiol:disulfide interchange protein DsbE